MPLNDFQPRSYWDQKWNNMDPRHILMVQFKYLNISNICFYKNKMKNYEKIGDIYHYSSHTIYLIFIIKFITLLQNPSTSKLFILSFHNCSCKMGTFQAYFTGISILNCFFYNMLTDYLPYEIFNSCNAQNQFL